MRSSTEPVTTNRQTLIVEDSEMDSLTVDGLKPFWKYKYTYK